MKSIFFTSAIINRNRVKFLYGLNEVTLEPYYICRNKTGKKVVSDKNYLPPAKQPKNIEGE